MDNFIFSITSNSHMDEALKIAFKGAPGGKATHWRENKNRLEFAWTDPEKPDWVPFISPVTAEEIKPYIVGWLRDKAVYGPQPDHDGDNGKGWHMWTESWGHIGYDYEVFFAIEPVWAMYGK